MSNYTIEGLFFALQSRPEFASEFRASPDTILAKFPLTDGERRDIIDWNVRALSDQGVSNMLMMLAFQTVHGPQATPDYIKRLNMPTAQAIPA